MSDVLQHEDVFAYTPESKAKPIGNGIKRVLLSHDDQVTLAKVWFDAGAGNGCQANKRSQISYVLDGFFEVEIDGKTQILGPGGSFFIPSGKTHSTVCREPGTLLNVVGAARRAFPHLVQQDTSKIDCD